MSIGDQLPKDPEVGKGGTETVLPLQRCPYLYIKDTPEKGMFGTKFMIFKCVAYYSVNHIQILSRSSYRPEGRKKKTKIEKSQKPKTNRSKPSR